MELREYARVLWQSRWMIGVVTLVTVGLSLAFTYTQSPAPTFTATARLFVSGSASNESDIAEIGQFAVQRTKSYVELFNGDEIYQRVVRRLDLNETPQELAYKLRVSAIPETVILQILVDDPSADRAQILANAVAKEFVAFVTELETPRDKAEPIVRPILIDPAEKPTSPYGGPRPVRSLGLGLVLGSIIGVVLALIRQPVRPDGAE